MWRILETKELGKICKKLPSNLVKKYELWKNIVARHGPEKLKEFSGFNDETLKGQRLGQRSSRLNLQYRVIYSVEREIITVRVLEIIPHKY